MPAFQIDESLGIYVSYFHAISETDTRNIFTKNAGTIMLNGSSGPYDVTGVIQLLTNAAVLKPDGNDLLIPLKGQLVVPDNPGAGKWPLVILAHGQHRTFDNQGHQLLSYLGYTELQNHLAGKGIASYSIDLLFVNLLSNNEDSGFKIGALDNNQRILLFFLHLKLLKIMAGETINEPSSADVLTIRFFNGTSFDNIKNALGSTGSSVNTAIQDFSNKLFGKIDFTKLGIMGHSRGADTVTRIPAYFYKAGTLTDPAFPFNPEVNNRIKNLSAQIGQPSQDMIKCILALEPPATVNDADPTKHGFVIDNNQTMYFLGVGSNDEDVSLDAVRMYEYPACSKAMIAVNGASHKRFNTVWANDKIMVNGKLVEEFEGMPNPPHLLQKDVHIEILKNLYGACFTSTLTGSTGDLQYITKEKQIPVKLLADLDFQAAWKFGFPFQTAGNTLDNLDAKITDPSTKKLSNGTDSLVQDLTAYSLEKDNAGTSTIKIPVSLGSQDDLSKYTHFSFRFAKFFNPSSSTGRPEEKNFTIQLFENDNLIGKAIQGKDITQMELKALNAYHLKDDKGTRELRYFILLQTVEISLPGHFTPGDLSRVTRIEIDIIPDVTKATPRAGSTVALGTIGGGLVGGALGAYGGSLIESDGDTYEIVGGLLGAAAGSGSLYLILRPGTNVFAFKDFLLTNRQIPASTNP